MLTLHDCYLIALTIAILVAFAAAWVWVWDVFDGVPSDFRDDTNDYWGL